MRREMNLPNNFITSISELLNKEADTFLETLNNNAPVSVRFNPLKRSRNPLELTLPVEQVPWSEQGFYLKERPAFTFDPLFHAGYYYVQEASSMFIEHVVRELTDEPAVCLDLCAAPGGKSVGMLSALPQGSLLVSNEIIRQRANILSETMIKFGNSNSVVTNNSPSDFSSLPHFFDMILVDAPCSGEGMFRKDEVAIEEWSTDNVRMCAARQQNILSDIWSSLKPGGYLIYSTCTYNRSENEVNGLWAIEHLGAQFIEVDIDSSWGITSSFDESVKAYRFFPHKTKGEGLFVTILKKNDDSEASSHSTHKRSQTKKNKKSSSPLVKDSLYYEGLINNSRNYDYAEFDSRVIALPKSYSDTMLALKEKLKVVSMGIELGEIKGKNFIPSHVLAMSGEVDTAAFSLYELSFKEAISYLRSEAITIPQAPKGFVLLTYKNEPIGFAKNIGNRANNLYPNEWRIRSSYMPQDPLLIIK